MKTYYLSIAMLVSVITFGQITDDKLSSKICKTTIKESSSELIKSAAPFWTEDFASGIPTTWTNSSVPWVYRGPSTNPNQNTGSQGAYATSTNTILSPTKNNGFIIFDSDYYDNGGTAGNFGGGMYPTPHIGELKTGMIDCSQYADVTIMLNSYFRTFAGQAFIDFYINGVFNSRVQVHADIDVNDATAKDAVALVRMPATVAGNANVQMSFVFEGSTNMVNSFAGYYFWMIDDIELVETPSFLMDVTDVTQGGWYSTPTTNGFGMDYTFKPLLQSNANPYTFEMVIANVGAKDLHGAKLNVEVYDDINTLVAQRVSDTTTLAKYDTAVFVSNQPFAPTNTGLYEMRFWGSADSLSASDTTYMQAIITDTVYGRDYGSPDGNWRVGRSCGGMQLGNYFEIYAADEITSVSAYVSDYSVPGAKMFGVLYEIDTTASPTSFLQLAQTDDYIIQSADVDNWVTLAFNNPIYIDPQLGQQYMLAIGGYAHPIDTFGISTSGEAQATMSRIQDNGCNLGTQGFGYWYWISNTPMIRMNFGTGVTGIQETAFSGNLSVFPNPNHGYFTLKMEGVAKDNYTIRITNTVGQEVYQTNLVVNGMYNKNIDLSAFGKGVYFVEIRNSSASITERVVVD